MSKYIPEIGEYFYAASNPRLYRRCSVAAYKELSGRNTADKLPEHIFCLCTADSGEIKEDYFRNTAELFSLSDKDAHSRTFTVEYVLGVHCAHTPTCVIKPPIGIIPLRTHNALRLNDLISALSRYAEANTPVKPEWIKEVGELVEYQRQDYNARLILLSSK